MSAVHALKLARAAGVRIGIDGEALTLDADAAPPPGRCLGCGEAEHSHDPLLPFGTEPTGHAWLHSRCWPAWQARQKTEAVSALSNVEIHETSTLP